MVRLGRAFQILSPFEATASLSDRKLANVQKSRNRSKKGSLIFSGAVVGATICVMVLVPTDRVLLEVGVLGAGLVIGYLSLRYGTQPRWALCLILLVFMVVWFMLGTTGYVWFAGFLAGIYAAVARAQALTRQTVDPSGRRLCTAADRRLAAIQLSMPITRLDRGIHAQPSRLNQHRGDQ